MKVFGQLLAWIFVIGVLAVVVILVVAAPKWFFDLPRSTQATVGGVLAVVLVPTIAYFSTRSLDRRRSREEAIRPQKTKLYDDVISGFLSIFDLGDSTSPSTEAEMKTFFASIAPPLITYGSRKVIKAWVTVLRVSRQNEGKTDSGMKIMFAFEDLMKVMRADLGHGTFSQQQGELLGVFIRDIDDYLPSKSKAAPSPPETTAP
jgi:hypothetical protein